MSITTCELFKQTDINVQTSILGIDPKHYVPAAYKAAFYQLISYSLGNNILLYNNKITLTITKLDASNKTFICTGPTLMMFIKDYIRKVEPIRIDITYQDHNTRSWVFIIK